VSDYFLMLVDGTLIILTGVVGRRADAAWLLGVGGTGWEEGSIIF
jgi:hypothetical protein